MSLHIWRSRGASAALTAVTTTNLRPYRFLGLQARNPLLRTLTPRTLNVRRFQSVSNILNSPGHQFPPFRARTSDWPAILSRFHPTGLHADSIWRHNIHLVRQQRNVTFGRPMRHQRTSGRRRHYGSLKENHEGPKEKQDNKTTQISQKDDALSSSKVLASKPLIDRLSGMPHIHRPTKEELLAAASGFWSRLAVRFKWFSIRSVRPYNIDEIYALVSWILLGHVIWIIVGTTTFFSIIIFAVNTVMAQETLARWVGNYLTKSSGVRIVFESAVVPKWKDGVISFSNVFVSRRPGESGSHVTKGSPETAAAAAAAEIQTCKTVPGEARKEEDNHVQFDLSIHTINVTLSFAKWVNGHGLLKEVEVKGVRGVVDRTHVRNTVEAIDPRNYRYEHVPGDFEIDSFKLEDLLVTVYQPNGFRPFPVSIFSCDLPRLRKRWLFYDFMSATTMSGSFDNSLFTIHPRQTHNYTGEILIDGMASGDEKRSWKKQTRVRIDGLNIDHLNREVEGPFSWIHEGNVDIIADIMFPTDDDLGIIKLVSDVYDRFETTVTSATKRKCSPQQTNQSEELFQSSKGFSQDMDTVTPQTQETDAKFIIMDLRVHLNDVRAAVPIFTRDISYVNNALIRPIVAYINSRRTFIPINCQIIKQLNEFDGSWTLYDSGLMDDLSAETYNAFANDVLDDQARKRRIKKVGVWSLQLVAQALFLGLAGSLA